jgi:glycosyltransferase involved in cell wall biosynthesis
MRIAYVSTDAGVPVFGTKGCSIHVQEFLRPLLRNGSEVRLYTSRMGGNPIPGLEDVKVSVLPVNREGGAARREQAALAANETLRRILEQDGPFDLVYERHSLFSYSAMEYARSARVPGLLEVNAPLIEEQSQYRTLVDRDGAERAARRSFKAASVLVAVSEEVATTYLERFPETHGRVRVVANGVDPDQFRPKYVADGSRIGLFTVGFVGSLKGWHGLPNLVEAFARLATLTPDVRLLIVGDGPERERLETALRDRRILDAATFTGAVPHDQVPALLGSMDVAVAPYPKLSNFYFSPLKIYEYMAAGLAVVASRTGQVAQLIDDGVTGLLYEAGDVDGLLNALVRLAHDPGLRLSLGRAARDAVVRAHTWDSVVKRVLELAHLESLAADSLAGAVT